MHVRALLLATLALLPIGPAGCAKADDLPTLPAAARDGGAVERDTYVRVDTGGAIDSGAAPIEEDTATAPEDTAVDSAVADTAPLVDGGPATLVYDDYPDIPSRAPLAVTALGYTTIRGDFATVLTKLAEGGFDLIVVDAPNAPLPAGLDAKLIDWMKGGGRLILSHWQLDLQPALTAELGVTATKYNVVRPIYKNASGVDLFSTPASVPSPINGTGTTFGVHGFTFAVAAPSALAGRVDSDSGDGSIAITHGGKVIVNGFLPADFANVDSDADGKTDVQELFENELTYVRSK